MDDISHNDAPHSENESDTFSEIDDDETPMMTLLEHCLEKMKLYQLHLEKDKSPLVLLKIHMQSI